jgi:UDP-glucose 4-epimerase
MKILVTGSTGRVGRAIYVRLCRDHEVVGLDRVPSSTADVVADLGDVGALERALSGVDAVVHTAALHAPQVGFVADALFDAVNVRCTETLARLAVQAEAKRFVFTSTTALYGTASTPNDRAGWVDETTVPEPTSIYHRTKLAAEHVLEAIAGEGRLAVTVLRMSRCFPEPVASMAAYRLHRGVDARDVAEAHALALQSERRPFGRFVISADTPFGREDVHDLLHDAPGVLERRAPDLVETFAHRGWALPRSIDRVYVPARAAEELGWRSRYGFEEVIRMLDEESSEVIPPRWR